jgi:hypothetical protein
MIAPPPFDAGRTSDPLAVGMVLFPSYTHLDLAGPYEVLARLPATRGRSAP